MNLAALTKDQHAHLRLRQLSSYGFARNNGAVPLYLPELARAAHEFPIIFTAEPNGFFPAAMLGIGPERNLFVDVDGRWLAGYIPAVWRRSAFRLARAEGHDEWVLCVDLDSDLISESDGEPLFDPDGNAAGFVSATGRFLAELESARLATEAACAALDRQGLLSPWSLTITAQDGGKQEISGLFRIDEARLAKLDGAALAELHGAQALAMAYAQLISMQKLAVLGRLAADRHAEQQRRASLEQGKLDLDRIFGIVEDDPFIF